MTKIQDRDRFLVRQGCELLARGRAIDLDEAIGQSSGESFATGSDGRCVCFVVGDGAYPVAPTRIPGSHQLNTIFGIAKVPIYRGFARAEGRYQRVDGSRVD